MELYITSRAVIAQLGYELNDRYSTVRFPVGAGNFLFTTASRTALGPTQPPIQWVPGALFLGVKRPGREADHSLPSSAEVKNAWNYTSIPQYVFMARGLMKQRDNFTLTFTLIDRLFLTYCEFQHFLSERQAFE
jgi:hypothetical protein